MLKVMIVDDDINVIEGLSTLIAWEDIGCELIATAQNGEVAYELAITHSPDIIICDVVMPVMDGTGLCQKIHETMSDVNFIFLSAYEDFSVAQLAIQYHVKDYIIKPLTRNKINYLIELIRKISVLSEKNDFYMRILHDYDTERQINQALMYNDTSYFEQLFLHLTTDIANSQIDIAHIRSVVYRLLNLLFTHMERVGNNCDKEREVIFNQMETLRFKMDLVFFASECLFRHIGIANKSACIYYKSLLYQVANYIDENYRRPELNALRVAAYFNYSSDYLGRLFPQHYGKSVSDYILEKRMTYAATLLIRKEYSITEVAEESGYPNSNYFSRVFRKYFGITPREYRTQYLKKRKE